MSNAFFHRLKLGATSAALAGAGLCGVASAQTLPVAGSPREAAVQDRDAIRGVREQDEAAARASSVLNRDARQDARQALNANERARGGDEANLRRDAQGDLRNTAAMNSGLGGANLGLWFNTQPGMNGLVVADVANQGAFAGSGFRQGDRVMSINGQPVTTEAQFVQALTSPNAGQTANIVINRNGAVQTLSVQPSAIRQGIMQTAQRPNVNAPTTQSAPSGIPGAAASGSAAAQGNVSTGANTVGQVDQSGLNGLGTVTPATSTTIPATVPSTLATQSPIPGAQNSSTPFAPAGPTNASAIGTPGPTLSTSPGNLSANQSAPTGLSTATPGFTGPSQLPSAAAGANLIGNPTVGGTGIGGLGTSGLSPANPAQTAIGTAGAAGATGTTGGTGSTAGGIGAVGGTGAMIGGTGSTAGPAGGSTATGALGAGSGVSGGGAVGAGAGGAGGAGAGGT
jgi:hypothetical protein